MSNEYGNELMESNGVVKFFSDSKGYGFVFLADKAFNFEPSNEQVFVHHSKIEAAGHRRLVEDQHVSMTYFREAKGLKADKVKPNEDWIRNNPDKFEQSHDSGRGGRSYGGGGYGGADYGGGYGGGGSRDHYQYGGGGGGGYGGQRHHDNRRGYGDGGYGNGSYGY